MRHPWIVVIFAAAMGILEAAVVVYLRRIYYPNGFGFPPVPMEPQILRIEVIREAATIVMLACVAFIAAERTWGRTMAFLVAFGTWDVLYYVGLKVFVGWPATLLDPDVLFLIPWPWVGPIVAPVLVSILWVTMGLALHRSQMRIGVPLVVIGLAASSLILASFLLPAGEPAAPRFRWALFIPGYLLGGGALALLHARRRTAQDC